MTQQPTPVGGNIEGTLPPAIILSHWDRYWVLITLTFQFSFDIFLLSKKINKINHYCVKSKSAKQ
jgi:hypothetical protein